MVGQLLGVPKQEMPTVAELGRRDAPRSLSTFVAVSQEAGDAADDDGRSLLHTK